MKVISRLTSFVILLTVSGWASAHETQAATGLLAGFWHTVSGFDHLIALIAIGVLSFRLRNSMNLMIPSAAVVFMLSGYILGATGMYMPAVEFMVGLSMIVFALIAWKAKYMKVIHVMPIVAIFSLYHGMAHGLYSGISAGGLTFMSGMALASVGLMLAGLAAQWYLYTAVAMYKCDHMRDCSTCDYHDRG